MPRAMTMISEWVLFLLSVQAAAIVASALLDHDAETVPPTPPPVVFQCGGSPCPAGQDCISVDGDLRCADPCSQYSVLDDAWRSTDFRNDGTLHCVAETTTHNTTAGFDWPHTHQEDFQKDNTTAGSDWPHSHQEDFQKDRHFQDSKNSSQGQ